MSATRTVPNGPDFSNIDSQVKAEEMFRRGELEKLFLFPMEFGGQDVSENIVYVPIGLAAVKQGIDVNVIGPLVSEGKITRYEAQPEYQGASVVPISIKITAWDPGQFSTTINVWGDALSREQSQ